MKDKHHKNNMPQGKHDKNMDRNQAGYNSNKPMNTPHHNEHKEQGQWSHQNQPPHHGQNPHGQGNWNNQNPKKK